MEKQKIFWVILSVSIFMVVLLIVGVFVVKQKPAAAISTDTVSPLSGMGTSIYELGQQKPETQAQGTASTEPEVLRFIIGDQTPEQPAPRTAPLPAPQLPQAAQPVEQPQKAAPAAESKPAAVAQKPAPARTAPEKPAQPRTVKTVEYWIQTGSYKSQTKAEDLSKLLSQKGLPGRVLSFALNSDTYFRVRIGPYTNKDEAGKFLYIVRQIEGLEASYISSVSATRTVN